ncbi:hypothetical protein OBBRIDRAFT_890832 [Obba rivulosa]|uniref:Uncharacterized protein n=1 Tax=Obba rivulosa TaxID=1052685 RepID=A0A8E2AJY1_9APHY|nr:hypothetical protein OBBRIDRAFT_890832 [Obba rivulosa]
MDTDVPGGHLDEELGPPIDLEHGVHPGPAPQEICDMVIDFVADSNFDSRPWSQETAERNAALRACMLTCKRFVERSRKYLYEELHLPAERICRSRLEVAYSPSRLGAYVRHLRLSGDTGSDGEVPDWLHAFIPLLSGLRNIHVLTMSYLEWGPLDSLTRTFILQHFGPTVTRLYLDRPSLFSSNQALRVLRSFPHLSELHITGSLWEYPNHTHVQLAPQGPLDLDDLVIRDTVVRGDNIIPWCVPVVEWLLADLLMNLFRKILPSFEELELVLEVADWPLKLWEHEPETYQLEDDELSDDDTMSKSHIDLVQRRQNRRAELEEETRHRMEEEETYEIFIEKFAPTVDLQAPELKRVDIWICLQYEAALATAVVDWIVSIAPPNAVLCIQIVMKYCGVAYENLKELDECIAEHLETWQRLSTKVTLDMFWPCRVERSWSRGRLDMDFPRPHFPLLEELGMPFEGTFARAVLSGEPSSEIQWSYGNPFI